MSGNIFYMIVLLGCTSGPTQGETCITSELYVPGVTTLEGCTNVAESLIIPSMRSMGLDVKRWQCQSRERNPLPQQTMFA
jgi:hypothetical protein